MTDIHVKHFLLEDVPEEIKKGLSQLGGRYQELLAHLNKNAVANVLCNKSKPIGYAFTQAESDSEASLIDLFIHPACRGNRFGSKLLVKTMRALSEKGINMLRCETGRENREFLVKNGFILTKEPTHFRGHSTCLFERPDLAFFLSVLAESKADSKRKGLIPLNCSSDTHHYKFAEEKQFMVFQRSMIAHAQREVQILCNNIMNPIFKDDFIRRCFLNLSKRNAQASIKILLEDDKVGAGYHNPVIDLSHRLSSFIEIRSIPHGSGKPGEMITCVDFDAGIYRQNYDSFTGFANFHNHLIAQRLRDNFQQHWQYATPSMQFRRLSL